MAFAKHSRVMSAQAQAQEAVSFLPKNLLVPTDFSAESHKALNYAQAFVERFGSAVHLVHIVEPMPVVAGIEVAPMPIDYPKQLGTFERKLAELAKELPPGSVARSIVREGLPVDDIVSVAKELRTDLIVISSHGHSGIRRVLFGSTAEGVVRIAPCPVLVLRPQEREFVETAKTTEKRAAFSLKTILVPIDFSEASRRALGYAIAFARQLGAKLICLHVLEVITYTDPDTTLAAQIQMLRKSLFEATERTLQGFLKEQTAQLPRENILTFSSAPREIIRIAEDRKADVILLAAHGQAGPGRFLLGSTAERVLRHAPCPVLIAKEKGS